MEKSNELSNLKKLSNILQIILKIAFYICAAGTGICSVCLISLPFLKKETLTRLLQEQNYLSISLSNVQISFNQINITSENLKKYISLMLIMIILALLILMFALKQIIYILTLIKEEKPFTKKTVKHLNLLGYATIIGSFLVNLASNTINYCLVKIGNLQSVLESTSIISKVNINFSVLNGFVILVGILILILAGVFKYASFLQDEYDSTI